MCVLCAFYFALCFFCFDELPFPVNEFVQAEILVFILFVALYPS